VRSVITLGTVILLGGVLLLIAAGVMFLLTSRSARELRTVTAAVPGPPAGRSGLIATEAVTAYGPEGPQTGPVSGADCVWWRVDVVRTPSRGSEDRTGSDDLGHVVSPGRAALTDGTAAVTVDSRVLERTVHSGLPAGTERTGTIGLSRVPSWVPRGMAGRLRPYEEIHLTEIRMPVGVAVFAVGTVRGGVLTPGRAGVFTTAPRDQVLATYGRDRSAARSMMRAFGVLGALATLSASGLLVAVLR
jgi:hypothetical protein